MVFNPVGERGEGEEIVLVNPRVSNYSKKVVPFTEGCLSFPGINADVMVIKNCLFFVWMLFHNTKILQFRSEVVNMFYLFENIMDYINI